MCDFCNNTEIVLYNYVVVKESQRVYDDSGNWVGVKFGEVKIEKYCLGCAKNILNWEPMFT